MDLPVPSEDDPKTAMYGPKTRNFLSARCARDSTFHATFKYYCVQGITSLLTPSHIRVTPVVAAQEEVVDCGHFEKSTGPFRHEGVVDCGLIETPEPFLSLIHI